jgi:hypothetical protein
VRPPIVLWSIPRSGSTAFERMMIERGDHHVLSEPFSHAYYDGPERRSARFETTRPDATVEQVMRDVLEHVEREPVFVKDMAYHIFQDDPEADAAFVARCTNTFLIRDPAWSVPSLARQWRDFTQEEVGMDALERMVAMVDHLGTDPIVVDNDDLRADPVGTVRAWCEAVGIPFVPAALAWEPGHREGWDRWSDWHATTTRTSGFLPPTGEPPPPVDDRRVADAITAARPAYERLRERRLPGASGDEAGGVSHSA